MASTYGKIQIMAKNIGASLSDFAMSALMPILPKDDLSYWVGRLVHLKLPDPARLASMQAFVKAYNIDMSEAELPIEDYQSIGDLFTRRLKEDARPIGSGLIHPCDSKVAEAGKISEGRLTQVKGVNYTCSELLQSNEVANVFNDGTFVTYYLCPTDYHRVHIPLDVSVEEVFHIPGAFWPVNAWSVNNVPKLYAINERVAMVFRTDQGERLALVMVAATNVGAITCSFESRVNSAERKAGRTVSHFVYGGDGMRSSVERRDQSVLEGPAIHLKKGDEAGIFSMGSSVVMLLDKNLSQRLGRDELGLTELSGQTVKLGQSLKS